MTDTATAPDAREAARIEAGRLLFAHPWDFVMGVAKPEQLPPVSGIEIAFAGRSNVGKSSLINALTGQHGLARTSNTPGRTRELNLFAAAPDLTLVDMPGYGYAATPRAVSETWKKLVFTYLRGRPNLRRAYLLIDGRHGLKENDAVVMELLDKAAVSYQVVLTKADKPRPAELNAVLRSVAAALKLRAAAHPTVLITSSETGLGMEALRAEISDLRLEQAEQR
jgi:GTP-binding protein